MLINYKITKIYLIQKTASYYVLSPWNNVSCMKIIDCLGIKGSCTLMFYSTTFSFNSSVQYDDQFMMNIRYINIKYIIDPLCSQNHSFTLLSPGVFPCHQGGEMFHRCDDLIIQYIQIIS